ncbi:MAG: hypothetical protein JWO31_3105 [Phycisphaerales bacterium]|nr:hypothetical protein [Phycisphaerales bacterium]
MTAASTPTRLDLQKDRQLSIEWQDGRHSVYPVGYLRAMCPCAKCKQERAEAAAAPKRLTLKVLPGNHDGPLAAAAAELVGGYALRIDWTDGHGSGIYSFDYLRSIDPGPADPPAGTRR